MAVLFANWSRGPGKGVATTPEGDLLFSAARAFLAPNANPDDRLTISKDLDWAMVAEKAEAHGVLPLLYRMVDRTRPAGMPPIELERLRRRFNDNELHMLLLSRELLRLLELMEARSIPVIPFKGPVLAAWLYGDPAMRRSDDLDLLIHEEDFWSASEVLESRGYKRHPAITRRQMAAYCRTECDMSYLHPASGMRVELHWAFLPPYHGVRIPVAPVWDRLGITDFLGREVLVLSAEDHLMVLCLHASKHMWRRLEWLCGIAALAQGVQPPDWERILRESRNRGCERILLLGLLLAHELLEARLADPVFARVRSMPSIPSLAAEARSELFSEEPPGFWELTRYRVRVTDRPADRIRYCASRMLLPSYADLEWIRLPGPMSFLYFLLRPVRLTSSWTLAAFTRSARRNEAGGNFQARKEP